MNLFYKILSTLITLLEKWKRNLSYLRSLRPREGRTINFSTQSILPIIYFNVQSTWASSSSIQPSTSRLRQRWCRTFVSLFIRNRCGTMVFSFLMSWVSLRGLPARKYKLFFAVGYLGMSSPQVVTPTNSKEHTPYWNIIALHMEALKSANTCVPAGKHGHAAVFWVSWRFGCDVLLLWFGFIALRGRV